MAKAEQKAQDHSAIYELSNRVARSCVAVIDTIVQRGAIKGEELSTIGQLRDQAVQIVQLVEEYQSSQGLDNTDSK